MLNYIAYLQALRLEKNKKWESALAAYQKIAKTQNQPTAKLAYRIGFVAEKIKDWETAETWLQRAVEADPTKAQWHYRLALAQELNKKFSLAVETYGQAIALQPKNPQYLYRLGKVLWICGKGVEAEKALHQAIELDPQNPKYAYELVAAIRKQGRTWQEVEALQAALALDAGNAQWQFELGEAQDKMNRFAEAGQAFAKANTLDPGKALWHFREGWAWERAEQDKNANAAYTAAIAADEALNAKDFGIGVFHQQRGFWSEAVLAYSRTIQKHPSNAELHYRLGLAYDRCYEWEQAAQSYRQALLLDIHQPAWHYRLGFVLERLERWQEASQAYREAVARSNRHNSLWYYRLGYVLMQMGQSEQAAEAFIRTRIFEKPHGMDLSSYEKNVELMRSIKYKEYYDNFPVKKNIILYESSQGASIGCNPLSIFIKIINDERYSEFYHVWVINYFDRIPSFIKKYKNVIFVKRESDLYLQYLSSAGFLINNNTFPPYFLRKPTQKYLNTWHGTPLKFLGREMIDGFMEHRNATRNFLQSTHIISPNSHTTKIFMEGFDIQGIYSGKIAETGYPRIDRSINKEKEKIINIKKRIGISNNLPIVLYAPTWRGTLSSGGDFNLERLKNDIENMSQLNCNFLFRGHHMLEGVLKETQLISSCVVPEDIDTNDLISLVDVLITDYSSIFFDFLPLNKPIIFYAYDLEEYSSSRGLYFPMSSMPGILCLDGKKLIDSLNNIIHNIETWMPDNIYKKAKQEFCPFEDGASTQRVINFFFQDDNSYTVNFPKKNRKSILMYAGPLNSNGITSSALNLLNEINQHKYDITLLLDAEIFQYPEQIERAKRIPREVKIIVKVGRSLQSAEEKWISDRFLKNHRFDNNEQKELYENSFISEFHRMFSKSDFDVILNFDGYNRFWAALLGIGSKANNKIIYLHNSMHGEWSLKYPYLSGIFYLYEYYNSAVSVSESVSIENQNLLNSYFEIPKEKFKFSNNLVQAKDIIEKSHESIDETVDAKFSSCTGKIFIACGRLSPEKGFEKLINAFSNVVKKYPETHLFIAGDGPLKDELKNVIQCNGLTHAVTLLGYIKNPFPLMKRADCFVFSSDYEGQGLVVLEALILGCPVISTDVVGPRSLLENGEGKLVPNDMHSLSIAMIDFVENGMGIHNFSYEQYMQTALMSFEKIIDA